MRSKPFLLACLVLALAGLACGLPSEQGSSSVAGGGEGARLYQSFGCSGCHSGDSGHGPALAGIYGSEERLDNGETVTVDEAYLRESILDPGARVVQGYQPIMPDFSGQLDEEQVDELVDYIRSMGSEADAGG